jgi:23S rRNA (uracil1939-C5)-methyltransferase
VSEIEITIEKIVPEGKGMGLFIDDTGKSFKVYVLGVYPGERVKVIPYKKAKDFIEAKLTEVIKKKPNRIEPIESHYQSHSPWQTINYDYQIDLKKEIIKKCFSSLANTKFEEIEISQSILKTKYRTKVEFSFDEESDADDKLKNIESYHREIFLAFHERGSHKKMLRIGKNFSLINEQMNKYAFDVLNWINSTNLQEFDLKSLTVRYSFFENKVVGLLALKNNKTRVQKAISKAKEIEVENIIIALSDHRSPIAKIDEVLFKKGDDFLIEKVGNLKFKYYLDSFFQNNISQFENTINDIKNFIGGREKVLELYCGVGSIGMHFTGGSELIGVEIVDSAVRAAKENLQLNNLTNYTPILMPSEKIDSELLEGIDCLIVDPPRSGLHKKVINMINEKLPEKIIYLSCNPITQASDYNLMKENYNITFIKAYDYYPNTPHIENLLILDKK